MTECLAGWMNERMGGWMVDLTWIELSWFGWACKHLAYCVSLWASQRVSRGVSKMKVKWNKWLICFFVNAAIAVVVGWLLPTVFSSFFFFELHFRGFCGVEKKSDGFKKLKMFPALFSVGFFGILVLFTKVY